ncbi:MAG: lipid A deacylase LpxR family protein [Bacteroidota bacterium]
MRFFLALLPVLFSTSLVFCQDKDKVYTKEFHLEVDNDAIVPPSLDRYYTSGIRLFYRKVASEKSFLSKIFNSKDSTKTKRKVLYSFMLGHQFYTPEGLENSDVSLFDRPYAGWVYGGTGVNAFYGSRFRLAFDFDLGFTGPSTGVGDLQEWYHEVLNFPVPRGWDFQIQNAIVSNLKSELNYVLLSKQDDGIELISNTSFQFGTLFNNIRQGATLRLINFKPIDKSIFYHSRLGEGLSKSLKKNKPPREVYLFYTYAYERVFHNSLIEGHIWGESSPHLETTEPNIHHHRVGIAFGGVGVDWHFSVHRNSPETTEAEGQTYGTVEIIARF